MIHTSIIDKQTLYLFMHNIKFLEFLEFLESSFHFNLFVFHILRIIFQISKCNCNSSVSYIFEETFMIIDFSHV